MHASAPSSLDSAALSRRLGELAGHEREVQVEFLLHLAEFDTRRAWAEAGYGSLWDYLLRVLHLREGAAFRRIAAMRVLRRLPVLAEALRDGRLCLSTVAVSGRSSPRRTSGSSSRAPPSSRRPRWSGSPPRSSRAPRRRTGCDCGRRARLRRSRPGRRRRSRPHHAVGRSLPAPPPCRAPAPLRPRARTLDRSTADTYSLCVTVDAALKKDIDELKALLSHKIPKETWRRCSAKRSSARSRSTASARAPPSRRGRGRARSRRSRRRRPSRAASPSPAAVRREVWKRDEGRCTWRGPDGQRCGSTWQVELDHIRPAALGGPSTVENLRILCRAHNALSAEHVFGRAHMEAVPEQARPGRVKVLPPAEVAAPAPEASRARSFAAGARTAPPTNVSRRTAPSRTVGSASRTTIARQHRTAPVLPLARLRPSSMPAAVRQPVARVRRRCDAGPPRSWPQASSTNRSRMSGSPRLHRVAVEVLHSLRAEHVLVDEEVAGAGRGPGG